MATRTRKLGTAALAVLRAIAEEHPYGFQIMDVTGLPGGSVYPALAALERDGLVDSRWEDPAIAQQEKRPPRRYYRISATGRDRLERQLAWLAGIAAPAAASKLR